LFQRLTFAETTDLNRGGTWAKVGSPIEASLLLKCNRDNRVLGDHLRKNGNSVIYYTRKLSHFVQILDFTPSITDERGQKRPPSELKELWFSEPAARDVFLAILNSTQFYWLLTVFSDCRNLNKREVLAVRFDFGKARPDAAQRLADLSQILMKDIQRTSQVLSMRYKGLGELKIQCTYPRLSKAIIDEIDSVLARLYGFTDEELDFIINYDIKYRMGQDGGDGEQEE